MLCKQFGFIKVVIRTAQERCHVTSGRKSRYFRFWVFDGIWTLGPLVYCVKILEFYDKDKGSSDAILCRDFYLLGATSYFYGKFLNGFYVLLISMTS